MGNIIVEDTLTGIVLHSEIAGIELSPNDEAVQYCAMLGAMDAKGKWDFISSLQSKLEARILTSASNKDLTHDLNVISFLQDKLTGKGSGCYSEQYAQDQTIIGDVVGRMNSHRLAISWKKDGRSYGSIGEIFVWRYVRWTAIGLMGVGGVIGAIGLWKKWQESK